LNGNLRGPEIVLEKMARSFFMGFKKSSSRKISKRHSRDENLQIPQMTIHSKARAEKNLLALFRFEISLMAKEKNDLEVFFILS